MDKDDTDGIEAEFQDLYPMQDDDFNDCDDFDLDVTEPLYVNIRTNQTNDGICPKRVRIKMGDKKTYYDTGIIINDHFKYKANNDDIYHTEHINDDACDWCPTSM